jgi:hypothetical protein
MVEVNDKTTKYKNWAAGGFLVLGYLIFFGSNLLPQIGFSDTSFFRLHWLARVGVIFLAIGLALMPSTGKERPTSVWFWIISAACLFGMFFLGPLFLGILVLLFRFGYIMYKSFESFKGYLARAVKSYRHLQSEIEKQ